MKKNSIPNIFRLVFILTLLIITNMTICAAADKQVYKTGELLVRFKTAVSSEVLIREAGRINSQAKTFEVLKADLLSRQNMTVKKANKTLNYEKMLFPKDQDVRVKANELMASEIVEWAEPNYKRYTFIALANGPNDPYYQFDQAIASSDYHGAGQVRAWWVEQVKADQVFAENLLISTSEVIIAILDSGVRLTHEDLVAKIVSGYDFANVDNDPSDDNGHGTHVAGLAAAISNNNAGVPGTGFLDNIKIMPVKVTDSSGSGYDSDICDGIQWAADQGAKVINMSFGSPVAGYTMEQAVQYAHRKGCVLVAAAGNYGDQDWEGYGINPVMYPASYKHVISVAATNSMNARSSFSGFNKYVDIAAPGGDWFRLYAYGPYDPAGMMISTYFNSDSNYEAILGTSMASPVVAGAAALVLAQDISRTPDEVESLLISRADKIGDVTYVGGYNEYYGFGQLNIYKALKQDKSFVTSTNSSASYNYPNPFNPAQDGLTNILIPSDGNNARLIIMNSFGHKVCELSKSGNDVWAGQIIQWDGRDEQGALVANGVYIFVLKVDDSIFRNKIVVKQ